MVDHGLFRQSNAIANYDLALGPILQASEEGEELVDGDLNEEDDNAEEEEEESAADSGEEDNEVEGRAEAEEETSEPEGMEEQSLRGTQHSRGVVLPQCSAHLHPHLHFDFQCLQLDT